MKTKTIHISERLADPTIVEGLTLMWRDSTLQTEGWGTPEPEVEVVPEPPAKPAPKKGKR